MGALLAITNTAAVVGFGAVAQNTEAFKAAVAAVTDIPGSPIYSRQPYDCQSSANF